MTTSFLLYRDRRDYLHKCKIIPEVRSKAIEIANALLEETSMEEGIAIATAIKRAKNKKEKGA